MATQSTLHLVQDDKRAQVGKSNSASFQWHAHRFYPILIGTDVTAASTKVITVTGILATDVIFSLALDGSGTIDYCVPTAGLLTFHSSAAAVPFQYVVLRPTAPSF